jgi:hypothetical protein
MEKGVELGREGRVGGGGPSDGHPQGRQPAAVLLPPRIPLASTVKSLESWLMMNFQESLFVSQHNSVGLTVVLIGSVAVTCCCYMLL